jgi:hypothetical protein
MYNFKNFDGVELLTLDHFRLEMCIWKGTGTVVQ